MSGFRAGLLGLAVLVFAAPSLAAADMERLIAAALSKDLELAKTTLGRRIAELKVAQAAASRGWKLALAPISYGIVPRFDPLALSPALSVRADYALTATAPGPASTSVYVSTDSTFSLPSAKLTPTLTLGVTQPLVSQHLRILKSAGVVHGERSGREVLYELVDDHLAHIVIDAVAHAEEG